MHHRLRYSTLCLHFFAYPLHLYQPTHFKNCALSPTPYISDCFHPYAPPYPFPPSPSISPIPPSSTTPMHVALLQLYLVHGRQRDLGTTLKKSSLLHTFSPNLQLVSNQQCSAKSNPYVKIFGTDK